MSVEDRLRRGLTRNQETVTPRVEAALERVLRRGRRRTRIRRAGAAMGAVAAFVAVVWLAGIVWPIAPRPHDDPVGVQEQALTGTFAVTLAEGDLAGRWTVGFDPDGKLTIGSPPSYHGVLSAALFDSRPGQLRTNLFGQDLCAGAGVGSYTWVRAGDALTFVTVDDACAGRVAFFTAPGWHMTR